MSRVRKALAIMVCLIVLAVSDGWSVEVGEPIPDFTLRAFDGSLVSALTVKGKPVLLIFWNTWCPNCKKELPEFKRLNDKYGPKGLAVLAVNTALNDNETRARAYWEQNAYTFPSGFDRYFEIGQAFGVISVPTIFLVDAGGVVRYKQAGLPENIDERLKQVTSNE